jgi:alpha-1,2-mannosyltransferase
MEGLAARLASGEWLDLRRLRVYCALLLALALVALIALAATSDGLNDYKRRPLGTDFSNVYAAGKWVRAGEPAAPYAPARQHAMEQRIFGADTPFYGWHYPPPFLALAALLAAFPYVAALVAWQAATLALYLWCVVAIVARSASRTGTPETAERGYVVLAALAYPAVFINIAHGHNGFLTAALIGGGLLLLEQRPVVAGALFGLLSYKPQFGVLIPFALAAGRHWLSFLAAAATVLLLQAASWLAFGGETWRAFFDSLAFTREVVLEQGDTGFHKIQSIFAALRAWHAPLWLAYGAQAGLAALVMGMTVAVWLRAGAFAPKAATLIAGSLLATPYVLDYDLVAAAPAIAFLVADGRARGFLSWEKSALAAIFVAPLLTRAVAEHSGIPLGLMALLVLFLLAIRRATTARGRGRAGGVATRLRASLAR